MNKQGDVVEEIIGRLDQQFIIKREGAYAGFGVN